MLHVPGHRHADTSTDGKWRGRRRRREREVGVDKDVVLRAVEEVVEVVVDGWGICALEHL